MTVEIAVRLARLFIVGAFLLTPGKATSFCSNDSLAAGTKHQFQFLAGYSPQSATLIGTANNRRFVLAGFEYSYRCWAWRNTSISFTPGIMPAAILLQPEERLTIYQSGYYSQVQTLSHAVYGLAILPIGFTFDFFRSHRIHPFFETRGGVIASSQPIPVNTTNATGLNFIFDLGGGVQWRFADRRAISFGYKFLHISNAYTTPYNPGVDNNVIYAGFDLLR